MRVERFISSLFRFSFVIRRENRPEICNVPWDWVACYYCYSMKAPEDFQVPGNSDKYPQHSLAQVLERNPYTGARTLRPLDPDKAGSTAS